MAIPVYIAGSASSVDWDVQDTSVALISNVTVASGTDTCFVLGVQSEDGGGTNFTNAALDGIQLDMVTSYVEGINNAGLWFGNGLTASTYNELRVTTSVSWTAGGADDAFFMWATFENVLQTAAPNYWEGLSSFSISAPGQTNVSTTITTTAANRMAIATGGGGDAATVSADGDGGQTTLAAITGETACGILTWELIASAGSDIQGFNFDGSRRVNIVAVALLPTADGGAVQQFLVRPPRLDGIGHGGIFPGNILHRLKYSV